jgi:two-component system phosphate regulon sensor histidine kinase PhoR
MQLLETLLALVAGLVGGLFVSRFTGGEGAWAAQGTELEGAPESVQGDERFERVLHNLPLAAITLDKRGAITSVNPTAAALFGFDPQRVEGRALIEAIPSIDLERQVAAALRGEGAMRKIVIPELEGDRTFNVAAFPTDRDGDVVLIASDQTALIALERVRREFISNVSHELRTPLSAIKLMVETVMLSEHDPEAEAMFLPKVLREVDRMVALVEDLLELAKSESGQLPLRRESFDLSAFAGQVIHMLAQRADSLDVRLEERAAGPLEIYADRNRLTQVLVNLLDNALRHTPAGGRVTVTVERGGEDAYLIVKDNGVGIPYHDLPHIFERFYVVERSRARETSGTGLGLSIARQLLEAHGGSITAESDLGVGATFTCRIPIETARAESKAS